MPWGASISEVPAVLSRRTPELTLSATFTGPAPNVQLFLEQSTDGGVTWTQRATATYTQTTPQTVRFNNAFLAGTALRRLRYVCADNVTVFNHQITWS